jgi:hypothetical protein
VSLGLSEAEIDVEREVEGNIGATDSSRTNK